MSNVKRIKDVKAGKWRTLESGWNAKFSCRFVKPAGAKIKIRYGGKWPFGKNSQNRTLDGNNAETVHVGLGSLAYARVQMKVQRETEVTYTYIATGP